jgi:energy-coupling factor transporter ATP-binding protein EcfA2
MPISGAKWWKFEFHAHTPASHDYGNGSEVETLKNRTPREWLLDYMLQGFDCIAITDHNSGEWVDRLKEELILLDNERPSGYRKLFLFPGVEINVNGGIHLLALFDPTFSTTDITKLLGSVRYNGIHGNTDSCTADSFVDVVAAIIRAKGIAIPAHADLDPCGLFHLQAKPGQGPTLTQNLRAEGLLGLEICGPKYSFPEIYQQLKLNLARIQGSDSHRPSDVGKNFTWVKMESPTLDAVRLALHDCDDGIKRSDESTGDPNDLGNRFFLREIQVRNCHKAGRNTSLQIPLSPWMTTIIGGRGSGKSSILNLLRIALNRRRNLPENIQNEFDEFAKESGGRGKPGMLLKDTEIQVILTKDGRDIRLTWSQGVWKEETRNPNTQQWEASPDPGDIMARFPINIFSQKQLYEMTEDTNVFIDLIDSQFDKRSWKDTREELGRQWMDSRLNERETASKLLGLSRFKAELEDIKAKIKVYEDGDHKVTLEAFRNSQAVKAAVSAKLDPIRIFSTDISEVVSSCPTLKFDDLKDVDENSLRHLKIYQDRWSKIREIISAAKSEIDAFVSAWDQEAKNFPFETKHNELLASYTTLTGKLRDAGQEDISGYDDLVSKKHDLERKLEQYASLEEEQKKLANTSQGLRDQIIELEKTLRQRRNDVVNEWNAASSTLQIELEAMCDVAKSEERLREYLRKPGTEFSGDIYKENGDGSTTGILSDVMGMADKDDSRWKKLDEIKARLIAASGQDAHGFDRRLAKHIEQLKANSPEDLDRLETWVPYDRIRLYLTNQKKKREDIEVGSAGQRTAGILALLMLLDDQPLIIDQPEDDLDTRLISELVVEGLRKLKKKQQVIVVSHNPNIPVNGAAEMIVEMGFISGQILCQNHGALQRLEIRNAVCEVMEGGKEALSKRYFRISKALL